MGMQIREATPILVPRRFIVIENILVREMDHSAGIGRQLMAKAEDWTREQGGAML